MYLDEKDNHPVVKALLRKGWIIFEIHHSKFRNGHNGWWIDATQSPEDHKILNGKFLGVTKKDAILTIQNDKFPAMKDGRYIKCFDRCDRELHDGDCVDVQKSGVHKIYSAKGQLCFTPYGKEECVWEYFSNDMVKCDSEGEARWVIAEPKKYNTMQGNKLIADFMGLYWNNENDLWEIKRGYTKHGNELLKVIVVPEYFINEPPMLFKRSYNWIMPVVMKIHSYTSHFTFEGTEFENGDLNYTVYLPQRDFGYGISHDSLVDAIYKASIDYIKWHNEQRL